MNTDHIIGQSPLIAGMKRILAGGRIVHAYLFTGPAGAGKKTMSGLFAQALLCTGQGNKPCRQCIVCRQFQSGNHPDVIRIKKPVDKTAIVVDQIRELQGIVKVKPYQAGKRVCFIEQAHLMTEQAQNALLKTLEEPPSHTLFFLLADNTNTLLSTILSRCQHFRIGSMSGEDISEILERRLSISRQDAAVYAALSQGNPGKAISLAEDDTFRHNREILIKGFSQAGSAGILELYDIFSRNKDRKEELLDILQIWIRDLLILKETGEWNLVVNLDQTHLLKRQVSRFTSAALRDMIKNIEESRRMLKNNSNYQLTVESLLLSF
ncbi:MAG: DNA polymerase III subunit delta' [Caldicoprobacterales bacterium]|jgi:DNA polymerase-3 subunit delta'|nr:DNA polymerase III subunit delta' [Clostridiales bacterium]